MRSLHSDKASGMIASLGSDFANLEQMAHRVGCALLDRDSPAEGPAQAYGEQAIGREFQRRQ
eukprot:6931681-Alexandrium_andersonii.AAC.1